MTRSLPPLVLFPALLFRDQPCEDTKVLLIFLYMHLLDIIAVTLAEEEECLAALEMQLLVCLFVCFKIGIANVICAVQLHLRRTLIHLYKIKTCV